MYAMSKPLSNVLDNGVCCNSDRGDIEICDCKYAMLERADKDSASKNVQSESTYTQTLDYKTASTLNSCL